MKTRIYIKGGRILGSREPVTKWAEGQKDGEYLLTIEKKKKPVSDPQRAYYYGVVLKTLMNYLGYDPEDTEQFHTHLKAMYFRIKPDSRGIYKDIPKIFSKSKDAKSEEAKPFIDWVVRLAAIEGVIIPEVE